jgi:hypothetical protein
VELGEGAALPVQPRPEAHIMTRHLIKFDTMRMLIQLPATLTLAQVGFLSLTKITAIYDPFC